MNRNIVIIAVLAVTAFVAVIAIPRLLDNDDAPGTGDRETVAGEKVEVGTGTDSGAGQSPQAEAPRTPQGNQAAVSPMLASQLAEAARQVNAGVPVAIDQITTLTRAEAVGNRIRYRYEVSQAMSPAQIQQMRQNIAAMNQQNICSRPDARQLIELGGEIEYAYYGPGGDFWFSTPITGC
jgi:hypothetical protein